MNLYNIKIGDNVDIITIIFRTFLYYFLFLLLFRIMGKREIGELGVNDLLVSVLFAEFATLAIEKYTEPLLATLIPTMIIVLLQVVISYLSLKSTKFRELIDSKPSLIIKDGKINFKEMERQRYGLEDLLTQIREKGYRNIEEVEYAILESNGSLSVFPYRDDKKNTPYPIPLIIDGKIQIDTLKDINKNKKWLESILNKKNLTIEDVFYAFYKDKNIFIIKKDELK